MIEKKYNWFNKKNKRLHSVCCIFFIFVFVWSCIKVSAFLMLMSLLPLICMSILVLSDHIERLEND